MSGVWKRSLKPPRHIPTLLHCYSRAMAAHASPRTTKLYDRTNDQVTLDEVEKIRL
jgi:hypothetical protein